MQRVKASLAFLVCAAACRPGAAPPRAGRSLVHVELLAGATHVVAGQPIELGARFRVAPGWHIYWINPGESGLATRVEIAAPGFATARVDYPAPISFRMANVVSYGYAREVVLFARLTAPAAPPASVRFTVRASWLVCREECIPGDAVVSLDVPLGERAAPANEDRFAPSRARLPAPAPAELAHEWREEGDTVVLALSLPGAGELELFPFDRQPALYRDQQPLAGGRLAVNFLRSGPPGETAVAGVLRVVDGGGTRYYSISIPWLQ